MNLASTDPTLRSSGAHCRGMSAVVVAPSLAGRAERAVAQIPARDPITELRTGRGRVAEVDAAPHAGVLDLLDEVVDGGVVTGGHGVGRDRALQIELDPACPEEGADRVGGSHRQAAVGRGVLRVGRRADERLPGRVGRRVGVAIRAGKRDGELWTPEQVVVLGVVAADLRVSADCPTAVLNCCAALVVQNRAIVPCSALRIVLVAPPTATTSLKSRAYAELDRAGGASGRNWSGRSMRNGRTRDTHGVTGTWPTGS